jgi:excisionase family DNA binding protein
VNEVADYLRVHRSTIYRLLRQHGIPAFRIGSDWRFNIEEIDRWRERQAAAHVAEPEIESRAKAGRKKS